MDGIVVGKEGICTEGICTEGKDDKVGAEGKDGICVDAKEGIEGKDGKSHEGSPHLATVPIPSIAFTI